MSADRHILETVALRIERGLATSQGRSLVVGLCGAQGSGKSTLASALQKHFEKRCIATSILSIDDLYRTLAEREAAGREVHPLLVTRGVPGTHDVSLGIDILDGIRAGRRTPLPRFDKALDERAPFSQWDEAPTGTRVVLFEGWCVGARPQSPAALASPINDLERTEDREGRWRSYVNDALAGEYEDLFRRLDLLILLAAPSFSTVFGWRLEQERVLRDRTGRGMTDDEIGRFVRHYERVTRHILDEMPSRADLTIRLNEQRKLMAPASFRSPG